MNYSKQEKTTISNRMMVLSYIMKYGPASRKTIAEWMGLTRASLSKLTAGLIADGYLQEGEERESKGVGRREIMLTICPDAGYALGLDVSNHAATMTLIDFSSNILDKVTLNYGNLTEEILAEILGHGQRMIDAAGRERIVGVGILSHGYIENDMCCSLAIKSVKQRVEQAYGLPCCMFNNVKAVAVAEQYFGNELKNFMVLKYGPGVGGVIVQNGEILDGTHNRAGEIGHIPWGKAEGKTCSICNKKGCLEMAVSFGTITEKITGTYVPKPMIDEFLATCSLDGGKALEEALHELAKATVLTAEVLDLEAILLAGQLFQIPVYYEKFLRLLQDHGCTLQPNAVYPIKDYQEKRHRAAAIIALNRFVENGILPTRNN